MRINCALDGIVDVFRPKQGLMDIENAGFDNVLLDLRLYRDQADRKNFERLEMELDAGNLNIPIAYAFFSQDEKTFTENCLIEELYNQAVESIRIAGKYGCKFVIIPPVSCEMNESFYVRLAEFAKEEHVRILLPNQCEYMNGHWVRGICSNPRDVVKLVDTLNNAVHTEDLFGFCLDTGICNLCGQDMNEVIAVLGNRIKAVILRECDGHTDTSMLPFTCVNYGQSRTDWLGLIRGLREMGFDGELILDIADTAKSFSPILRPQLMSLAKSVAEYFKWQIEIENLLKKYKKIVLFGAGNMCRNFMKCYGDTYKPMFTCDNNEALWGSQFCGLEVKSPNSLLELPEDCGIFICNIYYREIQHQLREMGVKNSIEFFNDEYMPTFYVDRVER